MKLVTVLLSRLGVLALCLATATSVGQPSNIKRILIITGEDYPGHLWKETTPVLKQQIERDPRMRVEVLDDLKKLATTDLSPYGAVVLHFKNYDPNVPGRAAFDALWKYVHAGGGLVLVHFASGAFQEFTVDFEHLAGRVWDPNRGHDPYGRFTVRVTDHNHPITAGLIDFETNDELYTCLAGSTPIQTLALATSSVDGKDYPMAIALKVGKGRIFHSPLGHDVPALSIPAVGQLFRRATAWAAQLKPDTRDAP
jgi:type 1 glutamine amidotransferase